MANKSEKNLVRSRSEYNAYYDGMRGVDFSTDPSRVDNNRFSYLVNMYRNYRSESGDAIETIPGYRKVAVSEERDDIEALIECKGLHTYTVKGETYFLSVIGDRLCYHKASQDDIEKAWIALYNKDNVVFTLDSHVVEAAESLVSFAVGERLYLIGANSMYVVYLNDIDGIVCDKLIELGGVCGSVYIPTTYKGVAPSGWRQDEENAYGVEYEQRNLLTDEFAVEFVGDGESREFVVPEAPEGLSLVSVSVGGVSVNAALSEGKVTLPESVDVPTEGVTVKVLLKKKIQNIKGAGFEGDAGGSVFILGCTKVAYFDNRIFLSGNPVCPNHIFWCGFNSLTGIIEPTYWGILDTTYDGLIGNITGIMAVSDTLVVLKEDCGEGTVYYHTPKETGENLTPKIYPSIRGTSNIGCLGACTNFLDDPVFVSRYGLEGIEAQSAGMERAIGHRSSNVDAKLLTHSLAELKKARLVEWDGYLLMLVGGDIFMADSRQRFRHDIGSVQYEWYYLDTIGSLDEETPLGKVYRYAYYLPSYLEGVTFNGKPFKAKDASDATRVPKDAEIKEVTDFVEVDEFGNTVTHEFNYVEDEDLCYLVYKTEETERGALHPATEIVVVGSDVYFIAYNALFKFNFDKFENGEMSAMWYTHDGRAITCGAAFKMDNCGIPHLTKSTVKKSTVIKMKPLRSSLAKVKVRTNKTPYHSLNRIQSVKFDFNDLDFSNFAFLSGEQSLFIIREKEKKWVEKQYYIYSDEFQRPFALYSLAFRYNVIGRYKE